MSAILREEPPDLSATNKSVQPGLERVVRHCLREEPRGEVPLRPRPRLRPRVAVRRIGAEAHDRQGDDPAPGWSRSASRRDLPGAGWNGGDLLAREARRPGATREIPPAHLPARHGRIGALRARRADHPLHGRVGREPSRGVRLAPRQPGVAPVRPLECGGPVGLSVGRDGRLAESPRLAPVHAYGHPRAPGNDRRRHAEGDPRRRAVRRVGPRRPESGHRSAAGRKGPARSLHSERSCTRQPVGSRTRESRPRATRSRFSITPRRATMPERPPSSTVRESGARSRRSSPARRGWPGRPTGPRCGSRPPPRDSTGRSEPRRARAAGGSSRRRRADSRSRTSRRRDEFWPSRRRRVRGSPCSCPAATRSAISPGSTGGSFATSRRTDR